MRRFFTALLLLTATVLPGSAYWQSRDSNYNLNIAGGSSLTCSYTPVLNATYNVAYTGATPSASSGSTPYVFSNTGSLPTGFTINTSTGVISGTDVTDSNGATYSGIQVQVTDATTTTVNCGSSFAIIVHTTQAQAFVARAISAYPSLDTTHQNAYYKMIDAIVAADSGVTWGLLDVLYLYAAQDASVALLNLISSSYTPTTGGTPTFTANSGYTSNSATGWINSNFNPATAGGNFSINSAHSSIWMNATNSVTFAAASSTGSGTYAYNAIFPYYTDNDTYWRINDISTGLSAGVNIGGTRVGFFLANRSGAAAQQGYFNSTDEGVVAVSAAASLLSQNYAAFGHNVSGTLGAYSGTGTIMEFSLGGSLTATQEGYLYTNIHTYLQTIAGVS